MNEREFMYWLKGVLTDRDKITTEGIKQILLEVDKVLEKKVTPPIKMTLKEAAPITDLTQCPYNPFTQPYPQYGSPINCNERSKE